MMRYSNLTGILALLFICSSIQSILAELYTSTDELMNSYATIQEPILESLDKSVRKLEGNLRNLKEAREALIEATKYHNSNNSELHPAEHFAFMRKLAGALEDLESCFEENHTTAQINDVHHFKQKLDQLKAEHRLPSVEDVVGCGLAILRLQEFYELEAKDFVFNRLPYNEKSKKSDKHGAKVMGFEDCFELGRIAFDNLKYRLAVNWFEMARDLLEYDRSKSSLTDKLESYDPMAEVLEHLAIAAYENSQLDYAAHITDLWLSIEPTNDRALENREFYREEMERIKQGTEAVQEGSINQGNSNIVGDPYKSYDVTKDEVIRNLCRTNDPNYSGSKSRLTCTTRLVISQNFQLHPELRIETLSLEPEIVRIHDFITDEEASRLRELARPRLSRSTVVTKNGLRTTDFRIAKTAWLNVEERTIELIEGRISSTFGLSLHEAEPIQVVNYGLGGYYGPHMDVGRKSDCSYANSENSNSQERAMTMANSTDRVMSPLVNNERIATVLMYLTPVESGGSTVFSEIELKVDPVYKSAVVWFNLLKSCKPDNLTWHAGCPVLLGSKWIATKWIREIANTFFRPCGLNMD